MKGPRLPGTEGPPYIALTSLSKVIIKRSSEVSIWSTYIVRHMLGKQFVERKKCGVRRGREIWGQYASHG